jgi:uncharacterized membrane protein
MTRSRFSTACLLSCVLASVTLVSPVWSLQSLPGTGDSSLAHERIGGAVGLLGRLHPVAVHFPIALLMAAALAEVLYVWRGKDAYAFTARFMLYTASFFAVVAVLLGLAAASGRTFSPDLGFHFGLHRVMGIVTGGLVVLTTGLAYGAKKQGGAWRYALYRVLLMVTVITVGIAAHSGATLVFGSGYISVF